MLVMRGRQQALGACAQSLDAQNVVVPARAPREALKAGCMGDLSLLRGMLRTRSVNPGA